MPLAISPEDNHWVIMGMDLVQRDAFPPGTASEEEEGRAAPSPRQQNPMKGGRVGLRVGAAAAKSERE